MVAFHILLPCVILLPLWISAAASVIQLDLGNETMDKTATGGMSLHYKSYDQATEDTEYLKQMNTWNNFMSFNGDACRKTWMYDLNGTCQCGPSVHGTVSCNNNSNQVSILRCYCMTYDSTEDVVLGSCPYGCGYFNDSSSWSRSGREIYHPLPLNVTDLNYGMCGRLNRDYRLCSKCSKGFSPLVYSYDLNCIKCNSKYNWLKYVAVAYIPLTIFYLIVVVFRIDANDPYLYGFIILNQGLASPTSLRAVFITITGKFAFGMRLLAIPYAIWNLDFLRSLPLNICLDLTMLQSLALDYAIAVYPLVLVVITYTLIELHARGCRVLVWLWRPFHRCCVRFTRIMDTKSSVIKAFATFLLLSYVKFINTTADILLPTKVYDIYGNLVGSYVFYDASYKYFGPEHLPFCILSIVFFLVFVLSPLMLLFLYPMSFFQRCLSTCRLRNHILHTFVDAFQGHYKDGIEPGTRDCRWFAAVYSLLRIIILYIIFGISKDVLCYALTGMFILLLVLVTSMLQPYKSTKVNNYHILMQIIMAIASFLIATLDQASIKNRRLMKPVTFSIGIVSFLPMLIAIVYASYKIYYKCRMIPKLLRKAKMPACTEDDYLNTKNCKTYQAVNDFKLL